MHVQLASRNKLSLLSTATQLLYADDEEIETTTTTITTTTATSAWYGCE